MRTRPTMRGGAFSALLVLASHGCALGQTPDQPPPSLEELERRYERRLEEVHRGYQGQIDRLQTRLRDLEERVSASDAESGRERLEELINQVASRQEERRVGLQSLGQTTLWDNTFNPALSVVGDFVLAASNRDDAFEDLNRFILRGVELGIAGRVDPLLAYYVFVHLDEDELELEEAFGVADSWLPDTLTLKFGRYNLDFGRLSPLHEHELPFVDKPGVIQEFLGGSLRGTGTELHHWFPVGDTSLIRWSAGVVNALDGDAHAVIGPLAGDHGHGHDDEEEAEPFGNRSLDDFAFNARMTALFELGLESTLQVGGSVAWAPEVRTFHPGKKKEEGSTSLDLDRLVAGIDLTFKWLDEGTGEGLTLGAEGLFTRARYLHEDEKKEDEEPFRESAFGFYVYGEYFFDRQWSAGASFDWFERAEDSGDTWWDAGAWVTWRVNEYNRLRLEGRYVEDGLLDDRYWVIMAQWTVIIGSHGHGIDW